MKETGILDNRVALVTGASRGIGRAVAIRLAAMGAFVYVNYLSNEEAARETLAAVERVGGRGAPAPFDVAHTENVRHATTKILKEQSSLDILVNNAGTTMNSLVLRTGEADWDALMNTNLKGTFNCCRAVLRGMLRRRWGRIVNMVSVVAEGGNAGQACYGASKAGVLGFTRSLAKEVGSRNICVNAVAPGFIETDMTTELDGKNRRRIIEQVPLGRMGNPGDVAGAVAFLVSPDAEYITGQVIRVNGGLYM